MTDDPHSIKFFNGSELIILPKGDHSGKGMSTEFLLDVESELAELKRQLNRKRMHIVR